MPCYVYILQSEKDSSFYKGFSENPYLRLLEHNSGLSTYTKTKIPWKLAYIEEWPDKTTALVREKNLKKADRNRIIALINSPKNLLTK